MNFLDVSPEVVDANVLPHLGWNDLLRLRRVCKWTKDIVHGYLKVHPELAPELEINEEEKTIVNFVKMGIPSNRIFLNNTSGYEFYEDGWQGVVDFINQYGSHVKSLRVDHMSFIPHGKELEFLNGLKNLQQLDVGSMGGYRRGLCPDEIARVVTSRNSLARREPRVERFPDFLQLSRALMSGNNEDTGVVDFYEFSSCLVTAGLTLEFLSLPLSTETNLSPAPVFNFGLAFSMLTNFMNMTWNSWEDNRHPPLDDFKCVDFKSLHRIGDEVPRLQEINHYLNALQNFFDICELAYTRDIKLLNVDSNWFKGLDVFSMRRPQFHIPNLGIPVVSLVNLHPHLLRLSMPNLERIEVKSTARSGLESRRHWVHRRPEWPSLKSLEINVDSEISTIFIVDLGDGYETSYETPTVEIFDFFFENVSRVALTELQLEFAEEPETVAVPDMQSVVQSCPNLKKFSLVNWRGTNESLAECWSGFRALEEISFERCKYLEDGAFIGDDVRSPVFLGLLELKKLSLRGLDKMTKITDNLFVEVIRHLKLTHFKMTSDAPIESVTLAGVRSLCDGNFGGSIHKFSFQGWSLSKVPEEDFKELETKFRSSRLLKFL